MSKTLFGAIRGFFFFCLERLKILLRLILKYVYGPVHTAAISVWKNLACGIFILCCGLAPFNRDNPCPIRQHGFCTETTRNKWHVHLYCTEFVQNFPHRGLQNPWWKDPRSRFTLSIMGSFPHRF